MNFLLNIFSSSYEELWKAVIRPYRDNYSDKDLGPEKFRLNSKYYKRTDFSLKNSRKQAIMCSYWEPYDEEREYTYLPCVIYLHGNSSSRCEVVPNLKYLLPLNITVFSFDFAACGRSEGEYISLGWYEILDVKCVINFLRKSHKVGPIGLWGRSMGAVTSIMYAEKDPTIGGIFLDSPFFSLNLLMDELSKEKVSFPGFLVKQVLNKVKETVKEKAGFNIDDIDTEKYCKNCFVPAFFCHGKDDKFVRLHHCNDLYMEYPGEKDILIVEGDHNDIRPDELNEKAAKFFYYALKCKYIKEINEYYFGYKLNISDWNNSKNKTPTGVDDNIDINNNINSNNIINNEKNKNKKYSQIIISKNEPENNYTKKAYINNFKENYNNNLKFNNKLKYRFKNININPEPLTKSELLEKTIKVNRVNKIVNKINNTENKIKNNILKENIKLNKSNDNIINVNFNNYKRVQITTSNLYPKDSFNYKKKNNNKIVRKKEKIISEPKLILKTQNSDNNNYKGKMYREIIKINYPNIPQYNRTLNRFNINENKSSSSFNKYKINNRMDNKITQINNDIYYKKENDINSYLPTEQSVTIKYPEPTLKPINYDYNYITPINTNYRKNTPNNIYYIQNNTNQNRSYIYYNNNIYI